MAWIFLVLLYGVLKGAREIAKKKAMMTNSLMEVLFTYTLISFLLVIPQAPNARGMELRFYFLIAFKSFVIFIAWISSFKSIKKLPIGVYGILDLTRVLFDTFFGILILGEILNPWQFLGLIVVSGGLLLLRFKPPFLRKIFRLEPESLVESSAVQGQRQYAASVYVMLALVSCFLNGISGLMDKILMRTLNSSQLQFWYLLFLVVFYFLYILVTREKINFSIFKNKWMWAMAIMFVIGDKSLFIANGFEASRLTVMTLLKQISCLITIIGGKIFFKEKNTLYKIFCASVIIIGILFGAIFK